jgi:hypothetical protein
MQQEQALYKIARATIAPENSHLLQSASPKHESLVKVQPLTHRYAANLKKEDDTPMGDSSCRSGQIRQVRNSLLPYLVQSTEKLMSSGKRVKVMIESTYAVESISKPLKLLPEPVMTVK